MQLSVEEIEKRIAESYELPNNVLEAIPNPVVTVRTSTYQHGPYIRQCIEGVLMQKTSFSVEYIIGEDFSTDGTREIVFEYAKKYPDKIRVITADRNMGMRVNGRRCRRASRGRYMALCEGDDYWTDPYKLQKQVDFLEAHPEYGLVHANFDRLYVETGKILNAVNESSKHQTHYKDQKDQDELFDLLLKSSYQICTATVLMRASILQSVHEQLDQITSHFLMGDKIIWLEMSRITKFYYFNEVFAVYRVLPESASRSKDRAKELRFQLSSAELRVYFAKKYKGDIPEYIRRRYNRSLLLYKTVAPDYKEMYSLIQPTMVEKFFYKARFLPIRFFVRLWFRMFFTKDRVLQVLYKH